MKKIVDERLSGCKLLVVNTGSIRKRFILSRLKQLGVKIVCLNAEKNWADSLVSDWIIPARFDFDTCFEDIVDYQEQHFDAPIQGILTFWEDDVILTAKLADALEFPGVGVRGASVARQKSEFRRFLQECGLPTPKAMPLYEEADCQRASECLNFPMVLKPVFGASSAYVTRVDTFEELLAGFRYVSTTLSTLVESALKDGTTLMVEEYIEGDEVDLDLILQNGKLKFWSIADNDRTSEPFFVETGESVPSQLPVNEQKALISCAEEVLERMGILDGCIHFEAKSTRQGPVPIEVNLRMGGDEVYYNVKHAWGFDLIQAAALLAAGFYIKPFEKPELPLEYLRGKYVLPEIAGVLTKVDIPKDELKALGVRQFEFSKKVGDSVRIPPEGFEYLGWLIAAGRSAHEASKNLDDAFSKIQVEIAPFRATSSIGRTQRRTPFSSARLRAPQTLRAPKFFSESEFTKEQLRSLKVGVACNRFTSSEALVELELSSVGDNIVSTLEERGYQPLFLDFNDPMAVMAQLRTEPIDLVFNVCERINDSSLLEPHAASVLDILQVPYTGSNPFTLALCIDKIRLKKLLAFHKIATPRWDYCYSMDDDMDHSLKYPRIVKPANSDNSIGITHDSVVRNEQEFKRQLEYVLLELKRPALVEEFIEGVEYDVSILGNDTGGLQVLPLSRSVFGDLPEGKWPIYAFDSKFGEENLTGVRIERPPKGVSKKQIALLSELAIDTYNVLGCSDYGRVEIRVDKAGNPFVLELNPNPSINMGDCLPSVAELVGMNYGDFLEEIMFSAVKRFRNLPPYAYLQAPLL